MEIVELTTEQFESFATYHPLSNYCQTIKYALVMSEYGYNYDLIGYRDETGALQAASLILTKKITGKTRYGYAPKGFLINYYDPTLLSHFLNDLKNYYKKKDFIFVKFNPEIIIGQTNKLMKYEMKYNLNVQIIDNLKTMGVKRRLELCEFNLIQPKMNVYLNLKQYDMRNLCRNYRKKIRNAEMKGLNIILKDAKDIEPLYKMIKNEKTRPLSYYRDLYNTFNRDNSIDLVYVTIDYQKYLTNVRTKFEKEQVNNDYWNEKIRQDPRRKNLNEKMDSDKKLQKYKEEIITATNGLKKKQQEIIAGALVIKHFNRVSIYISGFDRNYASLNPNHYLYHAIFERYKPYFTFCDMNGISGNFEATSEYHGLNQFKLKFNPTVYEFIGEFDLICSERIFKKLIKTSFIEDEFNKER